MSFDYNANLHRPTSILACNPLFANICFLGTLNPSVVGLRRNLVVLLVLHIIPMGGGGTAVEQGDHPIEALFLGRNIVHMPSVNTNSWGKMMSCDVSIFTRVTLKQMLPLLLDVSDTVLWDGFLLPLKNTPTTTGALLLALLIITSGLVTAGVLLLAVLFFFGPVLLVGCATAGCNYCVLSRVKFRWTYGHKNCCTWQALRLYSYQLAQR